MTLSACGQSSEENPELKENAKKHAIDFMKDLYGKDFQVEGYKFSNIEGGGTLWVEGQFEGEPKKSRNVQIRFNPDNFKEMEAKAAGTSSEVNKEN